MSSALDRPTADILSLPLLPLPSQTRPCSHFIGCRLAGPGNGCWWNKREPLSSANFTRSQKTVWRPHTLMAVAGAGSNFLFHLRQSIGSRLEGVFTFCYLCNVIFSCKPEVEKMKIWQWHEDFMVALFWTWMAQRDPLQSSRPPRITTGATRCLHILFIR